MENKFFLSSLVALALLSSISFALEPFFFKGFVFVNGSLAPNGTVIEAFVPAGSSVPVSSVAIGQGQLANLDSGKYVISFNANPGDNVSFKVNGVSLIAANGTSNVTQNLSGTITDSFNLSINKSANGAACTYAAGCTGGFCVHSLCRAASTFCGDSFCDSGESCSSDNSACSSGQACTNGCVATSATTSSGGGGGSSGGGAAATSLPSATTAPVTITADVPASVAIAETKLPVSEVVLTTNANVANVQVTVKEVSQPSAASVAISSDAGKVYKYIEITTTAPSAQVSKAKVKFKVDKVWLSSNSIDSSTVTLNRLVGADWTKLATTKLSEDFTSVYYEADAQGFSTFAITGEKVKAAPACGNGILETGEDCDGQQLGGQTCAAKGFSGGALKCAACRFDTSGCTSPTPPPPAEKPYEKPPEKAQPTAPDFTTPIIMIAVLLAVLLGGYWYFVKSRKK